MMIYLTSIIDNMTITRIYCHLQLPISCGLCFVVTAHLSVVFFTWWTD